jgi:hypothetical protein
MNSRSWWLAAAAVFLFLGAWWLRGIVFGDNFYLDGPIIVFLSVIIALTILWR